MRPVGLGARLLVAAASMAACARALPPPGGEPDRTPPQIVATTPEPLSVVEAFDGPVVFRFDERLSERNVDGSVIVSPSTGEVEVSRDGSELHVRLEGGWREGIVYRVVLAPGVRDLFNNERRTSVDLVFSTGPPILDTAFGGLISDRITGRPEPLALVEATRRADSLTYIAAVDSLGFFAYRNLPLGVYDVVAFADRNRNRRQDASEPVTMPLPVYLSTERDTVDLDLALIPNDTTPPRLVRAEGRDSMHVRLHIDDYLEPEAGLDRITVQLLMLPDSDSVAGPFRIVHPDTFDLLARQRADSARQRADSLRLDSLRAAAAAGDTAAARRLEAPPGPPALPRPPAGQGLPGQPAAGLAPGMLPPAGPAPYRELVLVPPEPLAPGRYAVTIANLVNISRVAGGGGTAEFEVRPPPPPDTTAPVRPDTTGAAARLRRR